MIKNDLTPRFLSLYAVVITIIVLVIAVVAPFLCFFLSLANSPSYDDLALERANHVLADLATDGIEVSSYNISMDEWISVERCIDFLQGTLARNKNQYILEVLQLTEDDYTIGVEFPDKTQFEMSFHAGTFGTCRIWKDGVRSPRSEQTSVTKQKGRIATPLISL